LRHRFRFDLHARLGVVISSISLVVHTDIVSWVGAGVERIRSLAWGSNVRRDGRELPAAAVRRL
jgi:hypothetical protein